MNFTPLASSSAGNAYLLASDGLSPLLIEAGVTIRRLRQSLDFGVSGLAGCLVSHEHGDHSKAVKDLLKAGIDCWMSSGTAKALGVEGHYRTQVALKCVFGVEGWKVLPFRLEHDAAEPIGFYIEDLCGETCLFIPDTACVVNRFLGATILCIECNFIPDILSRNIAAGLPLVVGSRIRRNHMSLDTVIGMILANDLTSCREIWLLHLSDGNSDEAVMRRQVQEATGIPTFCASRDSQAAGE